MLKSFLSLKFIFCADCLHFFFFYHQVNLKWRTEDMTATSGKDFEGGEGTLVFEHGETTKTIEITIYDDQVKL